MVDHEAYDFEKFSKKKSAQQRKNKMLLLLETCLFELRIEKKSLFFLVIFKNIYGQLGVRMTILNSFLGLSGGVTA